MKPLSGAVQQNPVLLNEQKSKQFIKEAADVAMQFNNETERRARIQAMRQRTNPPAREGVIWTDDEKKHLEDMYNDGIDISEMALDLERSEEAITQRLNKLGIPIKNRRSSGCRQRGCLCGQCELRTVCSHYQSLLG